MKKNVLFILLVLTTLHVYAEQYRIEDMNGDYIMYMGKRLTIGDVFEEIDSLYWQNSTAIIVMNTQTGNTDRLREEDFRPRDEFSFGSYFFKTNHGSSRACEDYCLCGLEDKVLYLQDTLRLRTDDPNIIYYYLDENKHVSLPKYYISYWYEGKVYKTSVPLVEDEILITKQLFENIPLNQSISISLFSIDPNGNIRFAANSIIIKIA